MVDLLDIRRDALKSLKPPARLDMATWIEKSVHLPAATSAHPGRIRLWPHQVEIARSIGDPRAERVTVLKAARTGYTQLLTAALGHYAVNDPAPVLVVLPAEADCRNLMVGSIEPTFAESPALRGALSADLSGRDTMLDRRFPGGSLKLVAARSPRNLRALTARCLFLDEVDGFEVDAGGEGDPVALAITRTRTFSPRKIVMGSTPVDEATSRVCASYDQSDRRVFECACPACGAAHEILWRDIHWQTDEDGKHRPETSHWACPDCGGIVEEGAEKSRFIRSGQWRVTRPEVQGHHGYRMSALISLLPNAAWPVLVSEFLEAKRSPETLKAWTNTVLGEPWRDAGDDLDEGDLLSRREQFGLTAIPADVLLITCGVDMQDDRAEYVVLGHGRTDLFVLSSGVIWGRFDTADLWLELDDLLKSSWPHPLGGTLRIDAALIDSGDGDHAPHVYSFTKPRFSRRVAASKGMPGFSRLPLQRSTVKGQPLFIVGSDALKNQIFNRLQAGTGLRFSEDLDPRFFEELTSERRIVRYVRGQPIRAFERIPGKRAEGLDGLVYAMAARHLVGFDLDRRESELQSQAAPVAKVSPVIRSNWLGR
ncbi:MAG: phage terminase large subunit family protein [Asticcacaulis sp.]|uniref:phage terminase large subunit family protein n=1 Tax=Asticcacaulis sp. TaxID=1872648 RepID=UPI003F7C18A0